MTWVYPLKAAAYIQEPEPTTEFINYAKFHKKTIPSQDNGGGQVAVKKPDDGRGVLQPRKVIQSGNDKPIQKEYSGKIYSKEEVVQLIKDYSQSYGISPERPLRIAKCESGYNQFSKNKSSSASGVFQFLTKTWASKPLALQGKSVFDADANVHTAIWLMSLGKYSMWECK